MGIDTIEQGTIGNIKYRIALIGDKYTVYIQENRTLNEKDLEYSAYGSFDTLDEAKKYLELKSKT